MSTFNLNEVTLIGYASAEPKVFEKAEAHSEFATLSFATNKTWKHNGEKQSKAIWHNLVFSGENLTKIAKKYIKKGSFLHIQGELSYKSVKDESGKAYTTASILVKEVGFLSSGTSDDTAPRSVADESLQQAKEVLQGTQAA